MGFLKTVPLSVAEKFLKVHLCRAILRNKERFCQLRGKMNNVCFFPRGKEQRCASLGAVLGLSSANGSTTGKLPWTELGWGWCPPGMLVVEVYRCTAQSCRNGQGWTRSCEKFSLRLVPRGGFAPERQKKLKLEKPKCFGLGGFTRLSWLVGLGEGCLWHHAINSCTALSVNCSRLLLTLSREKCDFFIVVYFLINPVLSLCIPLSSETLFLLHLMAFLLPTRRLTVQGWHFSSVSFSSCQLFSFFFLPFFFFSPLWWQYFSV